MEVIKDREVIILLCAGTGLILFMVIIVVWAIIAYQKKVLEQKEDLRKKELEYQNNLLKASFEVADKERKLIAENLHDDVGANLTVVKRNLRSIQSDLVEPEEVLAKQELNNKLLDEVLQTVRNLTSQVSNPLVENFGFFTGLNGLIEKFNGVEGIKVNYIHDTIMPERFNAEKELQLFRVTSEVLNNIVKHSLPKMICINIDLLDNKFCLKFSHDGIPMSDLEMKEITLGSKGMGLKNIVGRLQVIGGTIYYNGNEILITLPLHAGNYESN